MNLTNSFDLQNFLKARGLKPKDYLGQNFLVSEEVLQEIVKIADLSAEGGSASGGKPTDTVLEIGPGLGVLTGELAPKVKKLIAVEKDPKLFSILKTDFKNLPQVELFNEDILKFHLAKNISGDYKVVANIPYYLTSKLLRDLLENETPPKLLVLMVQKEVGERVIASPGELSLLGISVQIYADAEIAAHVSRQNFWPVPKVDSVILKIAPKNKYPEITDKKLFFRIIKMAFSGKRKQVHNTLASGLKISKEEVLQILKSCGIDAAMRPQDIAIKDWVRLYQAIEAAKIL